MFTTLGQTLVELTIALGLLSRALAALPAEYPVLPQNAPELGSGYQTIAEAEKPHISEKWANKDGINEDNVFSIIDGLIRCESSGRRGAINPKDVDGRPKYGELQYDIRTWAWFEELFNYEGDPMNRKDAIHMTRLALLNGYAGHWGCFSKIKP